MPLAKPEDDFFAFGSNDFDMTPPKKKLKKEKKHHRHHHHHRHILKEDNKSAKASRAASLRTVSSPSDAVLSDSIPIKAEKMNSLPQGQNEKAASRSNHPVDDDIKKLLGLNNDNDEAADFLESSSEFSPQPAIVDEDKVSEIEAEDAFILNKMDTEISQVKKYDDVLWKRSGYKKDITGNFPVVFDGQTILAKKAPFEVTVILRYQDREFSIFLQAKGSTSFQKIRETVLRQVFQSNTVWSFTSAPDRLVFFIYDLNIIVNQVLRIGSLLRSSKKKLERTSSDGSFVLRTMLAPMDLALQIQAEEKKKSAASAVFQGDPGDHLDEALSSTITIQLKDRKTGKVTSISSSSSTTIESLANIFLVRMKYPDNLQVKMYGTSGQFTGKELSFVREDKSEVENEETQNENAAVDDKPEKSNLADHDKSNDNLTNKPQVINLDISSDEEKDDATELQNLEETFKAEDDTKCILVPTTVGFYNLRDHDTVELEYSEKELSKLKETLQSNTDEDEDGKDTASKDLLNNFDVKDDTYFGIKLVGKDGRPYLVGVKPETSIQSIIKYYREKANIPAKVQINLLFDDEPLNPSGKVGDTELEQDFMVDVLLK